MYVCVGNKTKAKELKLALLADCFCCFSGSLIWFYYFYYFYLNYLLRFYIFSVAVGLNAESFVGFGEYLGNWHKIGNSKTVNCNETAQTSRTSAEFQ